MMWDLMKYNRGFEDEFLDSEELKDAWKCGYKTAMKEIYGERGGYGERHHGRGGKIEEDDYPYDERRGRRMR